MDIVSVMEANRPTSRQMPMLRPSEFGSGQGNALESTRIVELFPVDPHQHKVDMTTTARCRNYQSLFTADPSHDNLMLRPAARGGFKNAAHRSDRGDQPIVIEIFPLIRLEFRKRSVFVFVRTPSTWKHHQHLLYINCSTVRLQDNVRNTCDFFIISIVAVIDYNSSLTATILLTGA